mgnify:CR=1 FL=1
MKQAKKIFTRMLMNNWGGVSHKIMEFHEYVNLFSGKSGSGKSTLLKIIAAFIKQDQGVCDIPEVSFVEQFPYLFTDSVKNNITCWKNFKEDEYQHVLQICKINEFLNDDQMILEKNASNLSGGQKQRIAIARALMNHKNVSLFDESFSGIDTKNALEILKNIIEEYKDQTMIFSIHQLELLEMMDKVIVMENGSIVFDIASYILIIKFFIDSSSPTVYLSNNSKK